MSLESVVKYGLPFRVKSDGVTGSRLDVASKMLDYLTENIRTFSGRLAAIRMDPDLSEAGKVKGVRSMRDEFMGILTKHQTGTIKPLDAQLGTLLAKLPALAVDRSSAADAIREAEVRTWLRGLTDEQRAAAFRYAIDDSDALTFAAFANAPTAMGLIQPRVLAEGQKLWAASKNPALAGEIDVLRSTIDLLKDAARSYTEIVEKETAPETTMRDRLQGEAEAAGE